MTMGRTTGRGAKVRQKSKRQGVCVKKTTVQQANRTVAAYFRRTGNLRAARPPLFVLRLRKGREIPAAVYPKLNMISGFSDTQISFSF